MRAGISSEKNSSRRSGMALSTPLPLAGRGWGWGSSYRALDFRKHVVNIRKYIVIPITQHAIAARFEKFCSRKICRGVLDVLTAVNFDNQFCAVARKVGDIPSDTD